MKKITYGLMIAILAMSAAPQRLYAAELSDIVSDAQITTIRTHCTDLLATLNRVRQADTLLRNDRGRLYRTVADKLMVPLNQRIASNQLDGSELVATTAKFNDEYQVFFAAYSAYDVSLAAALSINCTKQPTTFYDSVTAARDKRIALHDSSDRLVQLMQDYRKEFSAFKKKISKTMTTQSEKNDG